MDKNFLALFITPDRAQMQHISELLWPDLQFENSECTASLTDAFQMHVENPYKICFISETLSKGLEVFFKDIRTLGRDKNCVFVQVRASLAPDFDRSSMVSAGFHTIISSALTPGDKQALLDQMKVELHAREVESRAVDVEACISHLLTAIDNASREKKRGRAGSLNKLMKKFIELNVDFDQQVLKKYFDALVEKSDGAKPFESSKLSIPEKLFKKLPKLTEQGYRGASNRVFEKTKAVFAVDEQGKRKHARRIKLDAVPKLPAQEMAPADVEKAAASTPATESAPETSDKPVEE